MFWCYAFGVSVGVVKHYLPIVWHTILFLQLLLIHKFTKVGMCSIQWYFVRGNNLYTSITGDPVKRYVVGNIIVGKLLQSLIYGTFNYHKMLQMFY